ncbi:putative SPX domain-containing protein [Helianthus anomalus]
MKKLPVSTPKYDLLPLINTITASLMWYDVEKHILKKHDKISGKLSGALVRLPFIQKVLNEPFYKTDVLNNLVKKCERMLGQLFSMNDKQSSSFESTRRKEDDEPKEKSFVEVPKELIDIKNMENTYMKLTLSALEILKEIRSGSSVQQCVKMEEVWKEVPVLEEVAK